MKLFVSHTLDEAPEPEIFFISEYLRPIWTAVLFLCQKACTWNVRLLRWRIFWTRSYNNLFHVRDQSCALKSATQDFEEVKCVFTGHEIQFMNHIFDKGHRGNISINHYYNSNHWLWYETLKQSKCTNIFHAKSQTNTTDLTNVISENTYMSEQKPTQSKLIKLLPTKEEITERYLSYFCYIQSMWSSICTKNKLHFRLTYNKFALVYLSTEIYYISYLFVTPFLLSWISFRLKN